MLPIGISIRQSNKKNYIGLKEIADQLNVDRATYANWENEMFDTKSQYIPKLADILLLKLKNYLNRKRLFIFQTVLSMIEQEYLFLICQTGK